MDKIIVYADDREHKIIPLLQAHDNPKRFKIIVKRLTTSDYAIYYKDKLLICIERKSWVDLASSITDGRISNVQKLKLAREETGCKLVYLIEGREFLICKKLLPKIRIPYKCLRSHLDHLAIRDNIIVIRSVNYQDTTDRLIDFVENYCSLHKKLDDMLTPEELRKYNNDNPIGGKD